MSARILFLIGFVFASVSCDKAKDLTAKMVKTVQETVTSKRGLKEKLKPVDPALQKLVDQTADGAIFRRDLSFPTRLEVRTTRRHEMSFRYYQESAIEKGATKVNSTLAETTKFERAGELIRYIPESSSITDAATEDPKSPKNNSTEPVAKSVPTPPPVAFRKAGKTWLADERGNFRAAMLAQQLSPVFDVLLADNALAPRPNWLGKQRLKIGTSLVVTGDSLGMLIAGDAKGSLKLKLESFEPVDGHPCGVFSVAGDYSRKQFPDFNGNLTDQDVTIQTGKLWMSLLYPVILREELDTIESSKSGGHGGLVKRGQGFVKVSVTRAWKPLAP